MQPDNKISPPARDRLRAACFHASDRSLKRALVRMRIDPAHFPPETIEVAEAEMARREKVRTVGCRDGGAQPWRQPDSLSLVTGILLLTTIGLGIRGTLPEGAAVADPPVADSPVREPITYDLHLQTANDLQALVVSAKIELARLAVLELGRRGMVHQILALRDDSRAVIRAAAADACLAAGPTARGAVPCLIDELASQDDDRRQDAARLLRQIVRRYGPYREDTRVSSRAKDPPRG